MKPPHFLLTGNLYLKGGKPGKKVEIPVAADRKISTQKAENPICPNIKNYTN